MNFDSLISSIPDNDLTTFKIIVDGKELDDDLTLLSFDISYEVNRIPTAKFRFFDGDPALGDFKGSSNPKFENGKKLELKVGYHSKNNTVFTGVIVKHKINVDRNRCSYLNLECKDLAYIMTITRNSNHFKPQPEKKILQSILNKHYSSGFNVKTDKSFGKEVTQYQITDWDFLVSRAEKLGELLFIDAKGNIEIKKPNYGSSNVELKFGDNIYQFDAEIDSTKQYTRVEAKAWDNKNQKALDVTVNAADEPNIGNKSGLDISKSSGENILKIEHSGDINKAELECWAKAKLLRSRLAKLRGTITCDGRSDIKLGEVLALKGFGDKFNGDQAFISAIRHQLDKGSWKTIFQIGLSEETHSEKFNIQPPSSSGMNPKINGIQIGKVIKIEGDSAHRILVRLPIVKGSGKEGIWARFATLDAGDKRGTFFRPEVDDEVIVGFVNNDPNEAVILGMLHSGKHPPPIAIEKENKEKGFISRSNLHLVFNDDDKSILLKTPGGNQIFINEKEKMIIIEDQNKNSIQLDKSGIAIESSKDISIKTKTGNISIEGNNIEIKSNINTTVSASAQALFEGKAQAALKGGMVMIN